MEMRMLVFVTILPIGVGCSTVRQVELEGSDQWMAKAQRDLLHTDAQVTMTDGAVAKGTIIRLDVDSLSLKGEEDGAPQTEPLEEVSVIRPSRRVAPAIGGLIGGALIGALVGGAIAMENEEPQVETLGFNTAFAGIAGAAVGALIGAVAGGLVVGLATSVTDYRLVGSEAPIRPTRVGGAVPDSAQTAR